MQFINRFVLFSLRMHVQRQGIRHLRMLTSRLLSNTSNDNNNDSKKIISKSDIQDKAKKKNDAAKKKLMSLLDEMKTNSIQQTTDSSIHLTKPSQHPKPKSNKKSNKYRSKEMESAVKAVAAIAGSEAEKVESELTKSLQTISIIAEHNDDDQITSSDENVDDKVAKRLEGYDMEAVASTVEAVAAGVSSDDEPKQSELMKKLLAVESDIVENDKLKNIFLGMKVENADKIEASAFSPPDRAPKPKSSVAAVKQKNIDLFGDIPLNIFSVTDEIKENEVKDSLWKELQEKELKSQVTFAPANAFQDMIQLTEQGKHWKFPIDNFSDIGHEENVGFHEHVFLEHHLHGFPKKGPVRHFMELVCVGLSKNPYISVDRKIENIEWYRQYFKDKEHILKEYGVHE